MWFDNLPTVGKWAVFAAGCAVLIGLHNLFESDRLVNCMDKYGNDRVWCEDYLSWRDASSDYYP